MPKQAAPDGYGFCKVCGGLFELEDGELPPHGWVGKGTLVCPAKPVDIAEEGDVSP